MAAIALVVGLAPIASWDLWWHLKTGQLALDRLSTLPVDQFSLTAAGQPWHYKDLGAEVVLSFLYQHLGEGGLIAFKLAVSIGLAALLATATRRLFGRVAGWLIAPAVFWVASFRIIVRPSSFSLVGIVVMVLLIERLSRWREATAARGFLRAWAPIWGLVVVWTNLHRGVLIGVMLLWGFAAYTAGEWALARVRRLVDGGWIRPASPRRVGLALAGAAVATLAAGANPFGPGSVIGAIRVSFGGAQALTASSEWERLSAGALFSTFPVAAIVFAIAVPVALCVALSSRASDADPRPRHGHLLYVGLAAGLVWSGLSAARLLAPSALALFLPVGAGLSGIVAIAPRRPRTGRLLAGLTIVIALALAWRAANHPSFEPHTPGFAEDHYPDVAVSMIRDLPIAGEGYTTYTFAGYVIYHLWPDKHVLCDGRYDTVYPPGVVESCVRVERDPQAFARYAARYDLQWVLAHNRRGPSRRPDARYALDFLDVDPHWALIYWDTASRLYVRRDGPNRAIAVRLAFHILRPRDFDTSLMTALAASKRNPALLPVIERELRRVQAAAPDDVRTSVMVVLFLYETGRTSTDDYRAAVARLKARRSDAPAAVDQVLRWISRPR